MLNGYGCPFCNESKGEKAIEKFLIDNSILFKRQKKFPQKLRGIGGNPLSYDFYVPIYNLLIEYQGEFHEYMGKNAIQSKDQYDTQHEHDIRKRNYAHENSYNYLEIWYKDKNNINEIMKQEMRKYKNPVTTTA